MMGILGYCFPQAVDYKVHPLASLPACQLRHQIAVGLVMYEDVQL